MKRFHSNATAVLLVSAVVASAAGTTAAPAFAGSHYAQKKCDRLALQIAKKYSPKRGQHLSLAKQDSNNRKKIKEIVALIKHHGCR